MPNRSRKGNWFEENVLEEFTGLEKFDIKDRSLQTMTKDRCIIHSEQTLPKDYESVMASCIKNPRKNPHYEMLKDPIGPRTAKLEAAMKSEVESSYKTTQDNLYTANRKVEYVSDYNRNFGEMKGRRFDASGFDESKSNKVSDQPITFYSEGVEKGISSFPATFVMSKTNPFRRTNAFTADPYSAPTAHRCESNERPRTLPSVREFRQLKLIRTKLLSCAGDKLGLPSDSPELIMQIVASMWDLVTTEVADIPVDLVKGVLEGTYGCSLDKTDTYALLVAFDYEGMDRIYIPDLEDYIAGVSLEAGFLDTSEV